MGQIITCPSLYDDVATFLEADGMRVARRDNTLAVGSKFGYGETSEQVYVWVPTAEYTAGQRRDREDAFLARFAYYGDSPGQKYLVLPSLEGLSAEFRRTARQEYNVRLLTPVQFFDTGFKWEGANPGAATAASGLRRTGEARTAGRVPQPYETDTGGCGHDLLATLRSNLTGPPPDRPISIVTAPAGFGKSVLFQCLFAQLYNTFMAAKSGRRLGLRPLPLLPEHLAAATGPSLRALVQSFLNTEVARPLTVPMFEWMLTHGRATWLLDGLDEVIARDRSFFSDLLDIVTSPNGTTTPRILVCVRDSLLATNTGLRDFLDDAESWISVYRLRPWERPSVETFARARLGAGTAKAADFVDAVQAQPGVRELARTPFYCDLLLDQFNDDSHLRELSETELLRSAVDSIVRREYGKGLLQLKTVAEVDILDLLGEIAEEDYRGGFQGVPIDDVAELAEIVPDGLEDDDLAVVVEQIKQLAVFRGATLGKVTFAQDVVAEYLLGRQLGKRFEYHPEKFTQRIGVRPFPADSIVLRVLRDVVVRVGAVDRLAALTAQAVANPVAFRNLLRVILITPSALGLLKDLPLERQDLSDLRFVGVDLTGVSFRSANLEGVCFERANVERVDFTDAVLKSTTFDGCAESLRASSFGSLATFFSVVVDREVIDSHEDMAAWLAAGNATAGAVVQPCAAAAQLRYLFSKIVRPGGQARRDWLDAKAVVAGRRFMEPQPAVDAAVRHEFLVENKNRKRYQRPTGEAYSEIVTLVRNLQMGPSMRALVGDLCDRPGCAHVIDRVR